MDFSQLKVFRDIAVTRSFSRAAALNEISQSAASQHIQELERRLAMVLLDRSTRPLTVTDAGRLYLEFCREVLRRYEDLQASFDELKQRAEGTVNVVAIYSVGLSEMSELEQEFGHRHPEGRLHVEYLRPEKIYEAISADRADIGLVSYPEPTRDITAIPWRQEEMVVAASPYDPISSLATVRASDLNGLDFVGFDEGLPIERAVERFLEEHGARVRVVMRFDNLQMVKEAVTHRAGISIMPARILQTELAQGRLTAIPLAGGPLYRPLGIVHRKKKKFTRLALSFLELLQEKPAIVAVGIE